MIVFWLIISLLIVVTLLFVFWPLFYGKSYADIEQLTPQALRTAKLITAIFFLIVIPIFSLVFYYQQATGRQYFAWHKAQQQAALAQQLQVNLGTPEYVIQQLKQSLQKDKKNARNWYLLGRTYMAQQQFSQAADAFAKANDLQANDPDILFQYAQSLYLVQHTLDGKPSELLQQLLKLQPQNSLAINLLAIAAFQRNDYTTAIQYWKQLQQKYAADSDEAQAVAQAITEAQTALAKQTQQKNVVHKINIPISVTLDSKLKKHIAANDTLFIYARAANDSLAPFALVQKKVSDLPLKMSLNESMAVSPDLTLADADEIIVIARISKSGQTSVEAGDLQGQSSVVEMDKIPQLVPIVINEKVK